MQACQYLFVMANAELTSSRSANLANGLNNSIDEMLMNLESMKNSYEKYVCHYTFHF